MRAINSRIVEDPPAINPAVITTRMLKCTRIPRPAWLPSDGERSQLTMWRTSLTIARRQRASLNPGSGRPASSWTSTCLAHGSHVDVQIQPLAGEA